MLPPMTLGRLLAIAVFVGLVVGSGSASAEGISARFGNDAAVVGRDVIVRVEVTDPIGAVARVEVDLRPLGEGRWTTASAARQDATNPDDPWWRATFTSTTVWTEPPPAALQARARVYGARGGLLLALGDIEPLSIEVVTPTQFARRERAFGSADDGADTLAFAGYLGADGRAASSARARVYLGFGTPLARIAELIVYVTLGPAFERPEATAGGGPVVLGTELAARIYTRPLSSASWSLFAAPYGTADIRFPGVDAGGGLRAGAVFVVRSELSIELSLAGAVLAQAVSKADEDDPGVGFVGGLRIGLRLGAVRASK